MRDLANEVTVELGGGVKVTPHLVPHRGEYSETVGFGISSGTVRVLFIPDIDKWEQWGQDIADVVQSVDHALLDGTFYDGREVQRAVSEVPHPFIEESLKVFGGLDRE